MRKINNKSCGKEQRLTQDLKKLVEVTELINRTKSIISNTSLNNDDFLSNISGIGKLLHSIAWKEDDADCIRNKHGYRNRHKNADNKKNIEGAQIDFEGLGYLKHLKNNNNFQLKITSNLKLVSKSLDILNQKITFILAQESETINVIDTNNDAGGEFIRKIASYHKDIKCIDRLLELLSMTDQETYNTFDITNKIDRYWLGYFFIQIGETAKDISDYIKRDTDSKNDITRTLFSRLGHYRQKIKGSPNIIYGDNTIILKKIKDTLDSSKAKLKEFLLDIRDLMLDKFADGNEIDNYQSIAEIIEKEKKEETSLFKITNDQIIELSKSIKIGSTHSAYKKLKGAERELDSLKQGQLRLEMKKNKIEAAILSSVNNMADKKSIVGNIKPLTEILRKYITSFSNPEYAECINVSLESFLAGSKVSDLEKEAKEYAQNKNHEKEHLSEMRQKTIIARGLKKALEKIVDNKVIEQLSKISNKDCKNIVIKDLFFFLETIDTFTDSKEELEDVTTELAKKNVLIDNRQKYVKDLEDEIKNQKQDIDVLSKNKFINKNSNLLNKIIHEINYLKAIEESSDNPKTDFARKMVLGFLGQYFKDFLSIHESEGLDILQPNLGLKSALANVIQIRNKAIMHDNFNAKVNNDIGNIISDDILPWQHDLSLITYQLASALGFGQLLDVLPYKIRQYIIEQHYNESEELIVKTFYSMDALKRLLKFDKAIEEYQRIELLLSENDVRVELVLKIKLVLEEIYHSTLKDSNVSKSNQLLKDCLQLAGTIDDKLIANEYITDISYKLGDRLFIQYRIPEAIEAYQNIKSIFDESPQIYTTEISYLNRQLAICQILYGNGKGLHDLIKSLTQHNSGSVDQLGELIYSLGVIIPFAIEVNNFELAKKLINLQNVTYQMSINTLKDKVGQTYIWLEVVSNSNLAWLKYKQGVLIDNYKLIAESKELYLQALRNEEVIHPDSIFANKLYFKLVRTMLVLKDKDIENINSEKFKHILEDKNNVVNLVEQINFILSRIVGETFIKNAIEGEDKDILEAFKNNEFKANDQYHIIALSRELGILYDSLAEIFLNEKNYSKAAMYFTRSALSKSISHYISNLYKLKITNCLDDNKKWENLTLLFNINIVSNCLFEEVAELSKTYHTAALTRHLVKFNNGFHFAITSYCEGDLEIVGLIQKISNVLGTSNVSQDSETHQILKEIQENIKNDESFTLTYYALELLEDSNSEGILPAIELIMGQLQLPLRYKDAGRKLGFYFAAKLITKVEAGQFYQSQNTNLENINNYLKNNQTELTYYNQKIFEKNLNVFLESIDTNYEFLKWNLIQENSGTATVIPFDQTQHTGFCGWATDQGNLESFISRKLIDRITNLNNQGVQEYKDHKFLEALISYTDALSLVENNKYKSKSIDTSSILFNRARTFEALGEIAASLIDCEQVVKIKPLHQKAINYLKQHNKEDESIIIQQEIIKTEAQTIEIIKESREQNQQVNSISDVDLHNHSLADINADSLLGLGSYSE